MPPPLVLFLNLFIMKVAHINWISKDALEAEVVISDGQFQLLCFAQPFSGAINDIIESFPMAFDVIDIIKIDHDEFLINKLDGTFDQQISGKLIDKNAGLVKIGDIIVCIDSKQIPGDIVENDFIAFVCSRFDI